MGHFTDLIVEKTADMYFGKTVLQYQPKSCVLCNNRVDSNTCGVLKFYEDVCGFLFIAFITVTDSPHLLVLFFHWEFSLSTVIVGYSRDNELNLRSACCVSCEVMKQE